MNQLKTALLMAALTALLLSCGHALAGGGGLLAALVLSIGLNFGAYWFSDRLVMKMHAAREVVPEEAPGLFSIVSELARRAGIPTPRLYFLDEAAANAFATGRDPKHAAIAISAGLMRALTKDELAGVLAHEVAHIQRRDTLIMTVAATFAGAVGFLARLAFWTRQPHADGAVSANSVVGAVVWFVLAPLGGMLIQTAISRTREFLADEVGARLVGNPLALSAALAKIEAASSLAPLSTATAATAHLFIRNPLSGKGLLRLFQTHPPTSVRIERLEAMALRRVAQEV